MKKFILFLLIVASSVCLTSCQEHYSDGERVGYITKLSKRGTIFKTWEGALSMTQNESYGDTFYFSVESDSLAEIMRYYIKVGAKVQLVYHESQLNFFSTRGDTDLFVDEIYRLDSTKKQTQDTIFRKLYLDSLYSLK